MFYSFTKHCNPFFHGSESLIAGLDLGHGQGLSNSSVAGGWPSSVEFQPLGVLLRRNKVMESNGAVITDLHAELSDG